MKFWISKNNSDYFPYKSTENIVYILIYIHSEIFIWYWFLYKTDLSVGQKAKLISYFHSKKSKINFRQVIILNTGLYFKILNKLKEFWLFSVYIFIRYWLLYNTDWIVRLNAKLISYFKGKKSKINFKQVLTLDTEFRNFE